MDIRKEAFELEDYLIAQRRWLHRHPEVGTKEFATTAHIAEELRDAGVDEVQTFDDITGCVGIIRGTAPGKTVMLRADIDALPIREENDCDYCSVNDGVMHACGHDCHTAMLLTAARILARHKGELRGTVKLLFQMAEEIGTESRHYVEKGCLDDVDAIFGMHAWSLLDSGTASFEDGERMACSDRFTVTVRGKAAPADKPHLGSDAIVGAAAAVAALQGLVSRVNDPANSFVLSVCQMDGGSGRPELAEECVLVGTTRTFDKAFRSRLPELIRQTAAEAAAAYGCTAQAEYVFGPAPLINEHLELNEISRRAVSAVMGSRAIGHLDKMMGAEDFSVFMEKVPGVYGYLGVRNRAKGIDCVHHHPKFAVDEEQLKYGAGIYAQFAVDFLNS